MYKEYMYKEKEPDIYIKYLHLCMYKVHTQI